MTDLEQAIEWLRVKAALDGLALEYMAESATSSDEEIDPLLTILNAVATPAEAMRCPEVMALVDELHYIVLCLKTIALHSNDERFAGVSRVAWLRLQDILDSLDTQDQNKATEND